MLTQVKFWCTVYDWRGFGGDMNESGRQKVARYNWCPTSSRPSRQNYILTYSRLRKKEPFITLGGLGGGGGGLNICVFGTPPRNCRIDHRLTFYSVQLLLSRPKWLARVYETEFVTGGCRRSPSPVATGLYCKERSVRFQAVSTRLRQPIGAPPRLSQSFPQCCCWNGVQCYSRFALRTSQTALSGESTLLSIKGCVHVVSVC